jgi:hypothetical protein
MVSVLRANSHTFWVRALFKWTLSFLNAPRVLRARRNQAGTSHAACIYYRSHHTVAAIFSARISSMSQYKDTCDDSVTVNHLKKTAGNIKYSELGFSQNNTYFFMPTSHRTGTIDTACIYSRLYNATAVICSAITASLLQYNDTCDDSLTVNHLKKTAGNIKYSELRFSRPAPCTKPTNITPRTSFSGTIRVEDVGPN